jgi:hypothetical protein
MLSIKTRDGKTLDQILKEGLDYQPPPPRKRGGIKLIKKPSKDKAKEK